MNLFENLQLIKENDDNEVKTIRGVKCIFTNEYTAEQLYNYSENNLCYMYKFEDSSPSIGMPMRTYAYALSIYKRDENSYRVEGTYSRGSRSSEFNEVYTKDEIIPCYIDIKSARSLRNVN